MGQKTHPKGFRLGLTESWDSTWYANKKDYGANLIEDIRIRKFLEKELFTAQCSHIEINRYVGKIIINCRVVRLGIAVGTTVAGLIVAILSMIFYASLKFKMVKALNLVENEAVALGNLIKTRK